MTDGLALGPGRLLLIAAVIAAGCSSTGPVIGSEAPTSSSSPSQTATESTTAQPDPTTSVADVSQPFTGVGTPTELLPDDSTFRLAPVGGYLLTTLFWTPDVVGRFGHTDQWGSAGDGPFVEAVEEASRGVIFQRSWDDNIIWWQTEDGPQELLVAGQGQRLQLEGATWDLNHEPLVYYQRHTGTTPETTVSTLRSYNFDTGEVREIAVTGGWESGTDFSFVSGGVAVGRWWAEATSGIMVLDLISGEQLYHSDEVGLSCFDGDANCLSYEQATVIAGRVYGVRVIFNEATGVIDRKGIFSFDFETGTETLLVAFPWDNGTWYAEDMYGTTVSLRDGDGAPLPALTFSLDGQEVSTYPLAAFVRPAYLS